MPVATRMTTTHQVREIELITVSIAPEARRSHEVKKKANCRMIAFNVCSDEKGRCDESFHERAQHFSRENKQSIGTSLFFFVAARAMLYFLNSK